MTRPRPKIMDVLDGRDFNEVFAGLSAEERQAVLDDWSLWAMPYQRMPKGNWRRWAMIGGRGIGKSWTASKTVHEVARDVESLAGGIIAIVGRTHTDVRATNIESQTTGLLAAAPADFVPRWRPGPGLLEWPNGARGRVFSADSPESILGSNIAFAIGDEVARWPNGEITWWQFLELAVRVGRAQLMITTTPRPLKWLKKIVDDPMTIVTGATTFDNPYLAGGALDAYRTAFEGTSIGDQELRGMFLDTVAGALLRRYEYISDFRLNRAPDLVRIIVAVDPAITASKRSDITGIVVFGVDDKGHGYLLEDASGKYEIKNNEWALVVKALYDKYRADRVVAETNRGGDMVEAGMRAIDRNISYSSVTATRGKFTRGEPVGSLYEQGRIHHVGSFPELEGELTTWIQGDQSPNRMDALIWAATEAMLDAEVHEAWSGPLGYMGNRTTH